MSVLPAASAPADALCHHGRDTFRLNLHVRDLGHTIMFGPVGAGKSTHLCLCAAQLRRYSGMTLYCFDKGMSIYTYCKAAGGTHYNVAADDESLAFCPLQYLESRSDRAWARDWLEQICALNGLEVTPGQRNEIAGAITSMHAERAPDPDRFCSTVQDEDIRQVLKEYTIEGSMGHLFDAATTHWGWTRSPSSRWRNS